jgi:hypothetical protein
MGVWIPRREKGRFVCRPSAPTASWTVAEGRRAVRVGIWRSWVCVWGGRVLGLVLLESITRPRCRVPFLIFVCLWGIGNVLVLWWASRHAPLDTELWGPRELGSGFFEDAAGVLYFDEKVG